MEGYDARLTVRCPPCFGDALADFKEVLPQCDAGSQNGHVTAAAFPRKGEGQLLIFQGLHGWQVHPFPGFLDALFHRSERELLIVAVAYDVGTHAEGVETFFRTAVRTNPIE